MPLIRGEGREKRAVGLSKPMTERTSALRQVSLSAPKTNSGVVRAQEPEDGILLHPPTALSNEFAVPGLPTAPPGAPVGPVGPVGPAPDEHGGWFDGWFNGGHAMQGMPAASICLKGLEFGGGVYVLYPHWETNPAFTVTREINGVTQIRQEDFKYNTDFTPVGWVSYTTGSGLGVRARGWRFDQTASTFILNDGSATYSSAAPLGLQNQSTTNGDQLRYDSTLKINVVDLEAINDLNLGLWALKFGGGLRYAHMSQSYTHTEVPVTSLVDAISSGHQFRGIGPTFSVEVRRQLGMGGLGTFGLGGGPIGVSLYGSGRGSLLFGTGKQDAFQVANGDLTTLASTSRDDLLPVAELEIGAEFSKQMGHARWFVQAALVGQVWFGAGNAANNELIPVNVDPEVSDNSANLGLFGGKLVVGVEF